MWGYVVGGVILLKLLFGKKSYPKLNTEPFDGQLLTVNKEFDDKLDVIAKTCGTTFNILAFHLYSESGLNPQAHVNKNGKVYTFGLKDRGSIGPQTWGGGLFGLVRPYAHLFIGSLTFEQWLLSDATVQLGAVLTWLYPAKGKITEPWKARMWGFAPKHIDSPPGTTVYADSESYRVHKFLDGTIPGTTPDGKIAVDELIYKWTRDYNRLVARAKKHGGPIQIVI